MNKNQIRKIIIIAVATSGVILNAVYGIGLLNAFFAPSCDNATREILISAIALEFGWAALLGWVIFNPCTRRHILLFTIIPILFSNILHSVNQFINFHKSIDMIVLNISIGLVYSALYVTAYFLGKSCNEK